MVNIDKNQDQYFPDQEKKHCYSSLTEKKKQLETGISRHTLIILYKQISNIRKYFQMTSTVEDVLFGLL